ncbi:MAG: metallophosphoesterase family protein [Hyphomicrobiaceae bacterium]|nr:MAG: metallophosphoesterase family protein [Hyphomicrobiaceae bacterium]
MKPDFTATAPIFIFGGPYSNVRAVEAMRRRAQELGITPDRAICTGDVVAYCVEPEESAAAIRAWGCRAIAGNCEEQLAAGAADCGCGFEEGSECDRLAKGWYPFANERISPASRAWMGQLPATLRFTVAGVRFRVVHGGVDQVNRFIFASERAVIAQELSHAGADVVIAGHAGIPFIERANGRTWFNAGVIGMPANDGTPEGWYGLIESDGDQVVLSTRRLPYDHHGAAAAMRRFGHANGYARSLITGLWPSLDVLPETERAATGQKIRQRTVRIAARAMAARGAVASA